MGSVLSLLIALAVVSLLGALTTWWAWRALRDRQSYTIPNFDRDKQPIGFWFQTGLGIAFSVFCLILLLLMVTGLAAHLVQSVKL